MKQNPKAETSGDELDEMMDDFGRRPGLRKRIAYILLGALVALVPCTLCVRVYVVDIAKAQLTLAAGVLAAAVLMSLSYHNLAFSQSARLRAASSAPSKNSFRNRMAHYDAAVAAHNSRISTAGFAYSFAYNNAIFLLAAPFCASYIFGDKVSGELNALCSGATAAGIALFNSRSALKAIGE